jgi:hypothetical protein
MIVALSALNLHAQENAADLAHDLFRLALLSDDQAAGAVFVRAAAGRDELRRDLAPRLVLVERLGQIRFQRKTDEELVSLLGLAVHDHVAPIPAPILAEAGIRKQLVHGRRSLVRGWIESEGRNFLGRGQAADEVEAYTPEKPLVVDPLGSGLGVRSKGDFFSQQPIDRGGDFGSPIRSAGRSVKCQSNRQRKRH